jgi:survival-of-motor-neuron-related-splicing factor 30
MEAELQTYLDQIAYVNLQLESDPTNDELIKLKAELNEIVDLTKEAIAQTSTSHTKASASSNKDKGKAKETSNSNWQDNGQYKAGMDCMAKYKDGKWFVQHLHAKLALLTKQVPCSYKCCCRI